MKTIEFNISNLPIYRKKVIKNSKISTEENSTILDIIAKLDKIYYNEVLPNLSENEKDRVLYIKPSKSLLHILWNPEKNEVYDDVYFEARKGFSDNTQLPIKENMGMNLPDGAYIVVGPDVGC